VAKRTVLAVRHEDGHLELLEPLALPVGARVPITLDLADTEPAQGEPHETLGDFLRRLPAGSRTKDEIDTQLKEERDSWGER